MILNRASLDAAFTGFNAAFRRGMNAQGDDEWRRIAMETMSSTSKNLYPWLNAMPGVRKWVGERVLRGIASSKYELVNEDWEDTVVVNRNHIEDDELGVYTPMFEGLGGAARRFRSQVAFKALADGFTAACWDGQFFFDTDHPVLDKDGNPTSVSNFQGGSGTPWFLLDISREVKPIIIQKRRDFTMVRKDNVDDDNVFFRKEFIYGMDGRFVTGFGFWQLAYASKETLDYANFNAAIAAMGGLKADYGDPLNIKPMLLVAPYSLRAKALEVVKRERLANGESNINQDAVEVMISGWL